MSDEHPTHIKVPVDIWESMTAIILDRPAGEVFGLLQAMQQQAEPIHDQASLTAVEAG